LPPLGAGGLSVAGCFLDMDLATLGWNDFFAEAFAAVGRAGWVPARVVTEDKHHFTVVGESGPLAALIPGKLLHQRRANAELPKVGDWVAVEILPGEEKAVIRQILPRRTRLARKVTGREMEEQVLATNIDRAFITQALDDTFNLRRLERFLVMAHEGGAQPVVVLNKSDLGLRVAERSASAQHAAGESPVLVMSAHTGAGTERLREFIHPGETVVFLGTSGVGKSSLINLLYGDEVQPTIEVRQRDSKGRHATTARELILLPGGGLVIDTPGMREFHVWEAGEGLDDAFPEVAALAPGCQFRDCRHESETRCAVKQAVDDGRLPRARLESFRKLQRELGELVTGRREHAYTISKRRSKQGGRPLPPNPKHGDRDETDG
jgi:ribosome biogenesis GTPase